MKILPAILAPTVEELHKQLNKVQEFSDLLHFDIADGKLVPSTTPRPSEFPQLSDDKSIFWHLMVEKPLDYLEECLATEAAAIIVHAEAETSPDVLQKFQHNDILIGLAINPDTRVADIKHLIPQTDLVHVMTVVPGGQGHEFLGENLQKIPQLRALRDNLLISVDGGVNLDTIKTVARFKPNYVAVGSFLTRAEDPSTKFAQLKQALN